MKFSSPTPSKALRALAVLVAATIWGVLPGWATASAESTRVVCGPCLIVAQTSSQIGASEYDTQDLTREGIDESGFDQDGIDTQGLDTQGLDTQGLTREGIDESGFDQSGIDHQGMDTEGMDRSGLSPALNDDP